MGSVPSPLPRGVDLLAPRYGGHGAYEPTGGWRGLAFVFPESHPAVYPWDSAPPYPTTEGHPMMAGVAHGCGPAMRCDGFGTACLCRTSFTLVVGLGLEVGRGGVVGRLGHLVAFIQCIGVDGVYCVSCRSGLGRRSLCGLWPPIRFNVQEPAEQQIVFQLLAGAGTPPAVAPVAPRPGPPWSTSCRTLERGVSAPHRSHS